MMGNDTTSYRIAIGYFYIVASKAGRQLSFLTKLTVLPFLILFFVKDKVAYSIALLALIVLMDMDEARHIIKLIANKLICSGNVELNPGPNDLGEISVCHINARSFRNKVDLLQTEAESFDIITLSETWLCPAITNDSLTLTNFHPLVRKDRMDEAYGGVGIYVKDNMLCKPRPDLCTNGLEAVWVETKINQDKLLIGSFYRPPGAPVSYWGLVSENVRKINNEMVKFVILGDFNTNFLSNPATKLLDILNLFNLTQMVDKPTRITEDSQTCLDVIITQTPSLVKNIDIKAPILSDHSVPCALLRPLHFKNKTFKRLIYDYNKLDEVKFNNLLSNENWNTMLEHDDIDEAAEMLTEKFMNIAHQCMPSKIITVKSNDAPWMTCTIRKFIKLKNKLHKKAKQSNSENDWKRFRTERNKLINKIRERKLEYYQDLDNKISRNNDIDKKEWWKLVNNYMSRKGTKNNIPALSVNDKLVYSNTEKAEAFNDYFIEQCTVVEDDNEVLPDLDTSSSNLNDIKLTTDEVKRAIQELKQNKASGPDLVSNRLLLKSKESMAKLLTDFFNKCLDKERFPKCWKTANVTPIFKKGQSDLCSNYRPISLLSCVGKLFERCVQKHILNYLTSNHIITSYQSGFMTGDSTVYQLLGLYDDLVKNYDDKIATQVIFFDISKAFDRVWHRGLLHKLKAVGIQGKLLNWFHDYLYNRKQSVVINGESSSIKLVKAGVPQGSVLGPLLFLVYINDIVKDIDSDIRLFADDTCLALGLNDTARRVEQLNKDLKTIEAWAKKWKITFNQSKTVLLNFKNNNEITTDLTFYDTILAENQAHKHLGLTIQSDFKWDEHIRLISNRANLQINCLRFFKYRLSRKTLEIIYKSYILPIFDYADVVWDNITEYQSQSLENLHLEALRSIIGTVRGTSHAKIYKESGFSTLKERRQRHKLILFHKLVHGSMPDHLGDRLPPLVSTTNPYPRRNPLTRVKPRFKTERYRHSFFPSTVDLWNSLKLETLETKSLSKFKKDINSTLSIVPYYYYFGERKEQLLHCKLRLDMSDLNYNLYTRHVSEDPTCLCGQSVETVEHYLLSCPFYSNARRNTISNLNTEHIRKEILLSGDLQLSLNENKNIFKEVQKYIKMTKRFE